MIESATPSAALLLTGRDVPAAWPFALPDLGSRFPALVSFSLWQREEDLLRQLGHKLFEDRQLRVPEHIMDKILTASERSPAAIRDFIARADTKALAEGRSISASLVRELLGEMSGRITESGMPLTLVMKLRHTPAMAKARIPSGRNRSDWRRPAV